MNKTKQIVITCLFIIAFILSTTSLASMQVIHEDNIEYKIAPEKITASTYMPLDQIVKEINISIEELSNDKVLIMHKKYFYILTSNETSVQSNNKDLHKDMHMDNPILNVNGYMLIPVEFLTDYLDIKIIAKNYWFPGGKFPGKPGKDDEDRDEDKNMTANIYLDDDEYDEYDDMEVTIEIINQSNREEVLEFSSGKKYEIYIRNYQGNIVYTWSKNKNFIQAFQKIKLNPRGRKRYEEEIDLRGFRKGYYYIEAEIVAENFNIKTDIKRFYIDD